MISKDDLEAFEYYNQEEGSPTKASLEEEAKLRCMTPLDMVREYHQTAGIAIDVDYSKGDTSDLFRLRGKLINEECEEAMLQFDEGAEFGSEDVDVENLLKELADIVYVAYGAAATFGWDLDEAFRRVHQNNMGRMYQEDGTIKRREDGKIIRNKNYPTVNLSDLV